MKSDYSLQSQAASTGSDREQDAGEMEMTPGVSFIASKCEDMGLCLSHIVQRFFQRAEQSKAAYCDLIVNF